MATIVETTSRTSEDGGHLLVRVGRLIWEHFALLLLIDIVMLVALFPAVVLLLGGVPALALVVAVITCGPVLAGTMAATDRLVAGDGVSLTMVAGLMRRHALRGMVVLAVPATLAGVMLVLLEVMARVPDAGWLVVPLLLACSVAIMLAVAGVSVLSLATTGNLRGWPLWRASFAVGVANPVATFGVLSLVIVLVLLAPVAGSVLLAVTPAPLMVLCSAVCRETIGRYETNS